MLAAQEWGLAETPVFLTSTMQLGRVYDAACELLMDEQTAIGDEDVIIPIVAECDDSFLNENRRMQVAPGDVREALAAARASAGAGAPGTGPARSVAEGAVGAGTGMSCLGYKGGIGTASRVIPGGATVGVVTMTNFGDRERLTVAGVPAGQLLPDPAAAATGGQAGSGSGAGTARPGPAGSCIVVVLTDGPLDAAACQRLARRAGLGLARTGSTAHHGSGEIFLALATGLRAPRGAAPSRSPVTGSALDDYFAAVVEATEEAVLNSLLQAGTVTGRDGHTSYGLPAGPLRALLAGAPGTAR
jgi:D-aminopeptidase